MMEPTSSSAPGSDLTGLVEEKTNGKPSAWFFQCLPANMKPYQTQVFARAWVNSDLTQCWVHRQQCSTKHNTYVIEKSGPQFKLLKYPVSFLENCKSNDVSCLICLYILIIMERERESYIYMWGGNDHISYCWCHFASAVILFSWRLKRPPCGLPTLIAPAHCWTEVCDLGFPQLPRASKCIQRDEFTLNIVDIFGHLGVIPLTNICQPSHLLIIMAVTSKWGHSPKCIYNM